MSMHNHSEGSFQKINKTLNNPDSRGSMLRDEEEQSKSRKRCIIIVLLVLVLAAAITALILVLVFKNDKSSDSIGKGYDPYTISEEPVNGKWYFEMFLNKTGELNIAVPTNDTNPLEQELRYRASLVNFDSYNTLRLKVNPVETVTDENGVQSKVDKDVWEVPDDLLKGTSDDYGMRLSWAGFKSSSKNNGAPGIETSFFKTQNRNLVFSKYYIEMGFEVDSTHFYGFGERQGSFALEEGNYSSWSDGRDNHIDDGVIGGNSYGDHPFILMKLNNGKFGGIFFKNSNAKVVEIKHYGKKSVLNFRAIGGILDFFTFYNEDPEEVIRAYHMVIGSPSFPPFWALGFHQGAWRYNTTKLIDEVLEKYDQNDIPLEGIWFDIEYMNKYRNFEVDTSRFPRFTSIAQSIHTKGQKLVMIVDAGLAKDETYTSYKEASANSLLIKSNKTKDELVGKVWPNKTVFLDFQNPNTNEFMVKELDRLYKSTQFDGIWLDMNEVTSFCDGECPDDNSTDMYLNQTDYPFNPLGDRDLINQTISLDAYHYTVANQSQEKYTEYNMHSLYGIMQSKTTYDLWLKGSNLQGRRPFILSRSTFAGSGKYANHWLGDNFSLWEYMKASIAGIMNFNLFGIPLVGADVCGFHKNYTQDMCGRWMQLSTFYPFARNHYNLTDGMGHLLEPQEPYNMNDTYKSAARSAVYQRYEFLRYFYTCLFEISRNYKATLIKPLFFEFPEDEGTLENIEHTFMVGSALKVSPVLTEDDSKSDTFNSYFPKGAKFISLNDMTSIVGGSGGNVSLEASWNFTNVHQKEGTIIPHQNSSALSLPRTKNLIENLGIDLIVFPDTDDKATGTLYIDENGDDYSDYDLGFFQYYSIDYYNKSLVLSQLEGSVAKGSLDTGNQILSSIKILNQTGFSSNSNLTGCVYDNNLNPRKVNVTYDEKMKAININATTNDKMLFNSITSLQFALEDQDSTFCNPKYYVRDVKNVYKHDNADIVTKKIVDIATNTSSAMPSLTATFELMSDSVIRVLINDSSDAFEAPKETFNLNPKPSNISISIDNMLKLPEADEEFYYLVHEFNNPNIVLYSTQNQPFVYSEFYKKSTAVINSDGKIFGLGERVGEFFLAEGVYTLWARDIPSPIEDGKKPGKNIYGTHPVYFSKLAKSDQFFAVFDHNAGAQDYVIKKDGNDWKITQIKTSGVTDQFIILNDQISEVVHEYIELVGHPIMVPEWALGWHQCRYGYNNTDDVYNVVKNFIKYDIPLDVMWTDIDYMEAYKDFSVSNTDFKNLKENITDWQENYGIKYVPILDAAIAYDGGNDKAFKDGKSKDIFISNPNNDDPFVGRVWPGDAVYIDWLNDKAEDYWVDQMKKLHDELPFSGMWIDMNEASNFCSGQCYKDDVVEDPIQDKLFYVPGARDLNDKSIAIDAVHKSTGNTEFEAHSLYGFYMSKATSKFFNDTLGKRPFVITRSTYSGVGKYVSHWLGDNFASYDLLKYSVSGIMLFNIFGIPVTGADICGFIGNTNPQLCARWYALGAFYPFSRNHNNKVEIPQEPYVDMFNTTIPDSTMTYTDFFRLMYLRRYALHRYQYSYLHKASTEGKVYFKPLFFDYPSDSQAYNRIEHNILLGDSIKLSPILENLLTTSFYFPEKKAKWCPLWPGKINKCFDGGSEQKQATINYDDVWVHLKSGSIIPMQLGDLTNVTKNLNIDKLRNETLDLAILCDTLYKADGFIIYDDGETQDLNAYTEFYVNATGFSPFLPGTNYIDVDVTTVYDKATKTDTRDQMLGSVVVYNAAQFSLKASAKLELTNKSGKIEAMNTYDSKNDIARFILKEGAEVNLREIEHIYISSK